MNTDQLHAIENSNGISEKICPVTRQLLDINVNAESAPSRLWQTLSLVRELPSSCRRGKSSATRHAPSLVSQLRLRIRPRATRRKGPRQNHRLRRHDQAHPIRTSAPCKSCH